MLGATTDSESTSAPRGAELLPDAVVSERYRLVQVVGRGGMGEVWAARHLVTGREVAIKFLHSALVSRPDLRARFLKEARAAAGVKHPNVIDVLDAFETPEGRPAIVMELLRGETLGAKLRREAPLTLQETASLLLPVVSALGAAHAAGVVHRDVKPENIFLVDGAEGMLRSRVLDFGIAKWVEARDTPGRTESGVVLGTAAYMSPEQATLELGVDFRSDIWALGCILYECVAARRPLEGENVGQVVSELLTHGIVPLSERVPELPSEVASLVDAMLARRRDERLSRLDQVREVLERYTELRVPPIGEPAQSVVASPRSATPTDASAPTERIQRGPLPARDQPRVPPVVAEASKAKGAVPRRAWIVAGALAVASVIALVVRSSGDTPVVEAPAVVSVRAPSALAPNPPPVLATAPAPLASAATSGAAPTDPQAARKVSRPRTATAPATAPAPVPTAERPPATASARAPGLAEVPPF